MDCVGNLEIKLGLLALDTSGYGATKFDEVVMYLINL